MRLILGPSLLSDRMIRIAYCLHGGDDDSHALILSIAIKKLSENIRQHHHPTATHLDPLLL